MVSEQLICEVEKFLIKHFSFIKFEIYNYFNNNKIYYVQSKAHIFKNMEYTDREAFEMMDKIKYNNWLLYNEKSSVNYIAREFRLFGNINSGNKYKFAEIKGAVKDIIANEKLVQIIKFDPLIKDLINEGRHHVKGIYPDETKYRQNVTALVGTKVYFCDRSNNIVSPAYVIGNFADDKLHIAYFTNLNSDHMETNKLDINGWAVTGAFQNEVGLTPQQAIKNRMY